MTNEQAIALIRLNVATTDTAAANAVAEAALNYAITKVSRKRGVDFNREYKSGTLTSGTSSYDLGSAVFGANPGLWNIQEMFCTDAPGHQIVILGLDDFNDRARGGTSTGRPTIATVHSNPRILEVYPIPNANYTVVAYITKIISALKDIPEIYHDVVIDVAGLMLKAVADPNVQLQLVQQGLNDLAVDSGGGWSTGKIMVDRPLGGSDTQGRADSGNLVNA